METLTQRALMDLLDARPTFTAEACPSALIDGDLSTAFAAGVFPAARVVPVARVASDSDLSLPGGRVVRTVAWHDSRWLLVEGPEWRVRLCADSDGEAWAWVFGTTAALVDEIGAVIAGWNQPPTQQPDSVEVTFCYRSCWSASPPTRSYGGCTQPSRDPVDAWRRSKSAG